MPTDWKKAPLSTYSVVRVFENEDGYNYFIYLHPEGQIIVMRQKTDETELKFADGKFELTDAIDDRVSLDYVERDEI